MMSNFYVQNAGEGTEPYAAILPGNGGPGAEPAVLSTMPYVSPRQKFCSAKNDTCKGRAVKGSKPRLCQGHKKAQLAALDAKEASAQQAIEVIAEIERTAQEAIFVDAYREQAP